MSWLPVLSSTRPARAAWLVLVLGVSAAVAPPAVAQVATVDPRWTGWARCEIAVSGAGYSDRQTHRWTLGSAPPTKQGAMSVYAATWSVVGSGSLQRTEGKQTLAAEWATQVQEMSAPIAVVVRASDRHLMIKPWHPQQRARGGVTGTQRLTIDGKAQKPVTIGLEAFEWTFPTVEADATGRRASGTSAPAVTGRVGPMQPADARATASCSWEFLRNATT